MVCSRSASRPLIKRDGPVDQRPASVKVKSQMSEFEAVDARTISEAVFAPGRFVDRDHIWREISRR